MMTSQHSASDLPVVSDDNNHNNRRQQQISDDSLPPDEDEAWSVIRDARPLLPKAAFFLGDLRDGLPMLNMQAVFLISSKDFTEKQIGMLFLVFGLSQFLCMAPAGYFLDYAHHKIHWVVWASVVVAALTVLTPVLAGEGGSNMGLMILFKLIQGGVSAIIPPGFNGITLGIVGSTGFTYQVSRNRMMNHVGTALVVACGSLLAYFLYPNIGALFCVAPAAALGVFWYLRQIVPTHVHRDAARGLILESPTMTEYELADDVAACKQQAAAMNSTWDTMSTSQRTPSSCSEDAEAQQPQSSRGGYEAPIPPPSEVAGPRTNSFNGASNAAATDSTQSVYSSTANQQKAYSSKPSFHMGFREKTSSRGSEEDDGNDDGEFRPRTPLAVLMNPRLLIFTLIIFLFHLANSSVLPLVMQSLALRDAQAGILLSGLCILIAQGFMAFFAKLCGDWSPIWGRKKLILVGLCSLTLRCFILTMLLTAEESVETEHGAHVLKAMILSTQFLDSVGAGILGTLQILVTSDLSGGTGRFSLLLGFTTAAMCLGATVSGYLGQSLAQDYGYSFAFSALGIISLLPVLLYALFMPETLPDYARPQPKQHRIKRLKELLRRFNEHRQRMIKVARRHPFSKGKHHNRRPDTLPESPLAQGHVELV